MSSEYVRRSNRRFLRCADLEHVPFSPQSLAWPRTLAVALAFSLRSDDRRQIREGELLAAGEMGVTSLCYRGCRCAMR